MDGPAPAAHPKAGDSATWRHLLFTKAYRYKALLQKYWWIVFFTVAAGLAATAWKVATEQVVYVSSGRMMVSGKIILNDGATYSDEMTHFMNTQREMMQDEAVRQRAEARVRAKYPDAAPAPVQLDVRPLEGTSIFQLAASSGDPRYPQLFLDAVMDEYIATRREMRTQSSVDLEGGISEQIEREQTDLRKEEDRLISFQRENNVGFLEQEGNSAGAYLSKLNTQLADLKKEEQLLGMFETDQHVAREKARAESNDPSADGNDLHGHQSGPEIEYVRAKQQIELLKAERAEYARDLRPKHPIMVEFDRQIAQQQQLIDAYRKQSAEDLLRRREATRLEIQNLQKTIKEWETKALDLSQRLAEYNGIQSNINRLRAQLETLSRSKGSVEVSRNVDQDIVSIRQRATPPHAQKPGAVRTVAFGLAVGLLIGMLILVCIDQFDDRICSFSEFQVHFPDRVLAQIPTAPDKSGPIRPIQMKDERHAFVEAFRSLRSSLVFLPVEGTPPRVLLVTSAVPNEGKSTVAVNLAITLALSDLRVLLVDGDLRRGEIHRVFGLRNDVGLSDVLGGTHNASDAIKQTSIESLWLLTRGAPVPHPGELYLSKETDRFLKEIYPLYDYVIFDSSPIMAADDTTSIAPKTDATLFVFRFTSSHIRVSRKALDLLRERQTNIAGVVCNDVSEAMQEYYYHRYPEYHGTTAPHATEA